MERTTQLDQLVTLNKSCIHSLKLIKKYVSGQDRVRLGWELTYFAKQSKEFLKIYEECMPLLWEHDLSLNMEQVTQALLQIHEAQRNEDWILCADYGMLLLLPMLSEFQSQLSSILALKNYYDENMERLQHKDEALYLLLQDYERIWKASEYADAEYQVEATNMGDVTVSIEERGKKKYYIGNDDPSLDAFLEAGEFYRPEYTRYLLVGLEMGYFAGGLSLQAESGEIEVIVFESDLAFIQLAFTYMPMNWYWENSKASILYDPDGRQLGKYLPQKDYRTHFFYPSIERNRCEVLCHIGRDIILGETNAKAWKNVLLRNFYYNIENAQTDLSELRAAIAGKDVIIAGAGPSLKMEFEALKNRPKDCVLIAFGACLRALLKQEILPDYIIMSDPKPISYGQIAEIENLHIPMILLSTAYKKVTEKYQGPKMVLLQRGLEEAENYAKEHQLELFDTSGAVVTLTMDLVIRMGAGRIILIGQDLGFAGKENHVEGARQEDIQDYASFEMVEAIGGGKIPSSSPFILYRKWIEERIRKSDATMPVFNAGKLGARIRGTMEMNMRTIWNPQKD